MNSDRLPPDDPREWIRRAKSNLIIAGKFDPQVERPAKPTNGNE